MKSLSKRIHLPIFLILSFKAVVGAIDCPCFSEEVISYFTETNTDAELSCKNETTDIGLWALPLTPTDDWRHSYGFHVYDAGSESSCVMEGDAVLIISNDQAAVCKDLIINRCRNIGYQL